MPTAKIAAVTNHRTREEDGINANLNNDESWRRFIMDALHEPERAANRRNVQNSSRGSRTLVKLTIISGLNRA